MPETVEELVLDKKLIQPPILPYEGKIREDDGEAYEENKKTTTFEPGSDGISLPKGVKRIE